MTKVVIVSQKHRRRAFDVSPFLVPKIRGACMSALLLSGWKIGMFQRAFLALCSMSAKEFVKKKANPTMILSIIGGNMTMKSNHKLFTACLEFFLLQVRLRGQTSLASLGICLTQDIRPGHAAPRPLQVRGGQVRCHTPPELRDCPQCPHSTSLGR
mmetsp:Transcript_14835/g.40592  ORF Transcript_14835/g.40592 Transcript_14835/m.40592 type:complete len:156 (-) Transcript_14835:171-638(-)